MSRPKYLSPITQMSARLIEARAAGEDFDTVWDRAMRHGSEYAMRWPHGTEPRRDYREALEATRDEWEAAFYGWPTDTSARFAAMAERADTPEDPTERTDGRVVTA